MNFAHYRAHSEPLFQKLSILNIYKIYQTQLAIYMYQQTHNLLPQEHLKQFLTNSSLHTYNTRQKSNIHIEYTRTTCRKNTVRMLGPRLWNILPTEVKSAPALPVFKRRLRKLMLSSFTLNLGNFLFPLLKLLNSCVFLMVSMYTTEFSYSYTSGSYFILL